MKQHVSVRTSPVIFLNLTLLFFLVARCAHQGVSVEAAHPEPETSAAASDVGELPALGRAEFNRLAALENVPVYWRGEEGEPASERRSVEGAGRVHPTPADLLFYGDPDTIDVGAYVRAGTFTPAFQALYQRLLNRRRLEAVERELNAGRLVAITTALQQASADERKLVRHILRAANLIEELYARQVGTAAVQEVPSDSPSRELLRRNQGYWCLGPRTRHDPFCNALPSFPKRRSFSYPQDVTHDRAFCDALRRAPNSQALMDPFSVVRRHAGALVAVSYLEVYGDLMRAVAQELRAAAGALSEKEAAFRSYLIAAAEGFETNTWEKADEAWAAMNSANSAWYLRIAPDEVYSDPCNSKAGFHVSFARVNHSLAPMTAKLATLRQEMELGLTEVIGEPYEARDVAFVLPDFIDIILNAGDSRNAFGATVGQALPNWGPVAERGDRRMVVMTNLYANPDSKAVHERKAKLVLHPEDVATIRDDPLSDHLTILLHEAAHNFGPHSDYRVAGRPPRRIFGGLTASILEELKAQTAALWYVTWLRQHDYIDEKTARSALTNAVLWCFGQMSRGLSDESGRPSVYPTVGAVQIDHFLSVGALSFDSKIDPGASGEQGRFRIHMDKLLPAIEALLRDTGRIKASGNAEAAEHLIATHTGKPARERMRLALVSQRILRFPKESFSYAVVF